VTTTTTVPPSRRAADDQVVAAETHRVGRPTRRPYAIELREGRGDLFATHLAFNTAARFCFDWLLTVRGGLRAQTDAEQTQIAQQEAQRSYNDAIAALEAARQSGAAKATLRRLGEACEKTAAALAAVADAERARKIMLIRCWFTPELRGSRPAMQPSLERLDAILREDGLAGDELVAWREAALSVLEAPISHRAVWVDRRAVYAAERAQLQLSEEAVDDILFRSGFVARSAFVTFTYEPSAGRQAARTWLSKRAGSGLGQDTSALAHAYRAVAEAAEDPAATIEDIAAHQGLDVEGLFRALRGVGPAPRAYRRLRDLEAGRLEPAERAALAATARTAADKLNAATGKGPRPWSDALLANMSAALQLPFRGTRDHLAEFAGPLDAAVRRLCVFQSITVRNERLRDEREKARALQTAALPPDIAHWIDAYLEQRARDVGPASIDERTIAGWKRVAERFEACSTTQERLAALELIVHDQTIRPLGDLHLFRALAQSDAAPLRAQPEQLVRYAALPNTEILAPAAGHIDPYVSPAWVEYGESRYRLQTLENGRLELAVLRDGSVGEIAVAPRSRRLRRELLDAASTTGAPTAPRADRLGALAAAGKLVVAPVAITNGQLCVDRRKLAALAAIENSAARAKAAAALPWRLLFSAPLTQRRTDERIIERLRSLTGTTGRGRPILSNLPGIRVLGVSLGLRHAASCSVIELLSANDARALALRANLPPPQADQLFLIGTTEDGSPLKLRRVAGDEALAPWARIEPTFTLRLPGEEEDGQRLASPQERATAAAIARRLKLEIPKGRSALAIARGTLEGISLALRRNAALLRLAQRVRHPRQDGADPLDEVAAKRDADIARIFEETPARSERDRANIAAKLEALWQRRDEDLRVSVREARVLARPRGAAAKGLGGLSIARLEVVTLAWRLSRSFLKRPTPQDPRGRPLHEGAAQRLASVRARLALERIRLIAHGVVSAALGADRYSPTPAAIRTHEPCHAIVMPDLRTARVSRALARAQNRRIAVLAPARITSILCDLAELNGLFFATLPATYVSHRRGLTGAAGIRAQKIDVAAFVTQPRWERERGRRDTIGALARAYASRWNEATRIWTDQHGRAWHLRPDGTWDAPRGQAPQGLLLPRDGGPIFVDRAGFQTDSGENAATTVAIDAVMDPLWVGAWPNLLCDTKGNVDARLRHLPHVPRGRITTPSSTPGYAWRNGEQWLPTNTFWELVSAEACAAVAARAGLTGAFDDASAALSRARTAATPQA
jgi:hypothetical protein